MVLHRPAIGATMTSAENETVGVLSSLLNRRADNFQKIQQNYELTNKWLNKAMGYVSKLGPNLTSILG